MLASDTRGSQEAPNNPVVSREYLTHLFGVGLFICVGLDEREAIPFCVDIWQLNALIIPDIYPFSHMGDYIGSMGGT